MEALHCLSLHELSVQRDEEVQAVLGSLYDALLLAKALEGEGEEQWALVSLQEMVQEAAGAEKLHWQNDLVGAPEASELALD